LQIAAENVKILAKFVVLQREKGEPHCARDGKAKEREERERERERERETMFLISKDGVGFDLIIRSWNAATPLSQRLAPVF